MSQRGPVRIRRGDGGLYQSFVVASGRLILAVVVLAFLLFQALTSDYPYIGFLVALVVFVTILASTHWWKLGQRIETLELRPGGLLRVGYPLGQREFSSDDLEWVKVYPGRVSFGHDGREYEIRGIDTGLDALVDRLGELDVECSDRRD
jgi:hypothetical protein